jgi:hypothetical protein
MLTPAATTPPAIVARCGEAIAIDARVDALEVAMMQLPKADCPVRHTFTPGLYSREISFAAGTLITSKIHKTCHQWILSKGRLALLDKDSGRWEEIAAPASGTTRPGTRRVAFILDDAVFTTFHPTHLTDPAQIERELIYEHSEHLAGLVQPPPDRIKGGV